MMIKPKFLINSFLVSVLFSTNLKFPSQELHNPAGILSEGQSLLRGNPLRNNNLHNDDEVIELGDFASCSELESAKKYIRFLLKSQKKYSNKDYILNRFIRELKEKGGQVEFTNPLEEYLNNIKNPLKNLKKTLKNVSEEEYTSVKEKLSAIALEVFKHFAEISKKLFQGSGLEIIKTAAEANNLFEVLREEELNLTKNTKKFIVLKVGTPFKECPHEEFTRGYFENKHFWKAESQAFLEQSLTFKKVYGNAMIKDAKAKIEHSRLILSDNDLISSRLKVLKDKKHNINTLLEDIKKREELLKKKKWYNDKYFRGLVWCGCTAAGFFAGGGVSGAFAAEKVGEEMVKLALKEAIKKYAKSFACGAIVGAIVGGGVQALLKSEVDKFDEKLASVIKKYGSLNNCKNIEDVELAKVGKDADELTNKLRETQNLLNDLLKI